MALNHLGQFARWKQRKLNSLEQQDDVGYPIASALHVLLKRWQDIDKSLDRRDSNRMHAIGRLFCRVSERDYRTREPHIWHFDNSLQRYISGRKS
jgi:hypothetical protein